MYMVIYVGLIFVLGLANNSMRIISLFLAFFLDFPLSKLWGPLRQSKFDNIRHTQSRKKGKRWGCNQRQCRRTHKWVSQRSKPGARVKTHQNKLQLGFEI